MLIKIITQKLFLFSLNLIITVDTHNGCIFSTSSLLLQDSVSVSSDDSEEEWVRMGKIKKSGTSTLRELIVARGILENALLYTQMFINNFSCKKWKY